MGMDLEDTERSLCPHIICDVIHVLYFVSLLWSYFLFFFCCIFFWVRVRVRVFFFCVTEINHQRFHRRGPSLVSIAEDEDGYINRGGYSYDDGEYPSQRVASAAVAPHHRQRCVCVFVYTKYLYCCWLIAALARGHKSGTYRAGVCVCLCV